MSRSHVVLLQARARKNDYGGLMWSAVTMTAQPHSLSAEGMVPRAWARGTETERHRGGWGKHRADSTLTLFTRGPLHISCSTHGDLYGRDYISVTAAFPASWEHLTQTRCLESSSVSRIPDFRHPTDAPGSSNTHRHIPDFKDKFPVYF